MVRVVLAVVSGLILAALLAVAGGALAGLPLLGAADGTEPLLVRLVKAAWPALLLSLPVSLAAIAFGEARRLQSWDYWSLAGTIIGLFGYVALKAMGDAVAPEMTAGRAPLTFAVIGLLGGIAYWWIAGRNAGALGNAVRLFFHPAHDSEKGDSRRCALCAAAGLLLGLIPLALLGWYAFHKSTPPMAKTIAAMAALDADRMLKDAGLPALKFSVDQRPYHEHIGYVSGSVADYTAKTKAFEKAKSVLAPMIGMPGVVAVLQNDILALDEADPQVAAENARIRAAQDAARSLAEEAAALKKAENARLAAEADAKRKAAEETAAKRQAEEDAARLAAEADAKRKADEETAAKKKTEDDARLAAEADAKRKADEEAAAKRQAEEDAARLAAEADAKRKADEEAAAKRQAEEDAVRLAADTEAKGKASEEAVQKSNVEEAGRNEEAWVPGMGMDAMTITRVNCVSEFGQLFASEPLRFALKSASLESHHASFLDKLGDVAKKCDGIGLLIEGNSDPWGSEEFNQALSEQRAESVRAALVERGVSAKQLATRGFGELKPLVRERSRAADAANRRVDFGVIEIERLPQTILPKDVEPAKN